uniref:Dipeptidase E n=1 Tax=Megaselia scalaris TaxID=36166 RepID=T1GCE1_MEGSC
DQIETVLKPKDVKTVLFIPYALKNHDNYTKTVSDALTKWGYKVEGIHTHSDPVEAVKKSEAIFIGGGNTFVLLKTLYEKKLIETIRSRVLEEHIPYIGSSAGTNVATRSIHTTNDMPVAYPPTFDALKLVPFNINPHYLETDPSTKHKGETRDERIGEKDVKTVLFVPYALKNYDNYTKTVSDALTKWGYKVEGIHTHSDPVEAVKKSEAIFIGGGNTFVLLKTLYEKNLIETIRARVLGDHIPYIGSSAGTNVATKSIHTTNDMPV